MENTVSFAELNLDCLVLVFEFVKTLEELINYSKVCIRWRSAILTRIVKVKYLLFVDNYDDSNALGDDPLKLYCSTNGLKELFKQKDVINNFPNLRILDIGNSRTSKVPYKTIYKKPSIKGIISSGEYILRHDSINIEMISCNELKIAYLNGKLVKTNKCTQLYVNSTLQFECIEIFPKLLRLHLGNDKYDQNFDYFFDYSNGSWPLDKLKILELSFVLDHDHKKYFSFPRYRVIDDCPLLESAFVYTGTLGPFDLMQDNIKRVTPKLNSNLRDLVIQCTEGGQTWFSLRELLFSFPKLKHLAIRQNDNITDDIMIELVECAPEVILMDFRGSKGITKRSADFLNEYCSQSGRSSITIYYNCEDNEPSDWPKIIKTHDKVCYGFDFMKHCFFRTFQSLPNMLVD
ncbi:uncharacterized protein LOC128393965 isoform X1 [Panonychus citri]|uniref:uncharacterized protein LOC128393965 isoform X1 n=1 Tax=Panonychus citri TaxID=50023 RepID=UPI0023074D54|nr:uncharacterized protein LOC128393965 isoform X1 [Panonychus citri]